MSDRNCETCINKSYAEESTSPCRDCGIIGYFYEPKEAKQPTVDDWIPVTEKLPPKGVDVIVTDIETVKTYVGYYMGEGYWDTDNGPYRDRIVAWKPMPEPYKGE